MHKVKILCVRFSEALCCKTKYPFGENKVEIGVDQHAMGQKSVTNHASVHHRLIKPPVLFASVQLLVASSPKTRSCPQQEAMKSPLQAQGSDSRASPSTTAGLCPGAVQGTDAA